MSALEETWQRLGFENAAEVEKRLLHGTAVGVLGGLAGAWLGGLLRPYDPGAPVVSLAVSFAAGLLMLVLPRLTPGYRLALLGTTGLTTLFLPWANGSALPFFFTVPLGLVLALEPATWWRKLLAFAGPSLGAGWCVLVAYWLSARHLGLGTMPAWLALAGAGLFITAGAVLASVTFAVDTVEPKLVDQPRVRLAWLRLRAALDRLPKGEPRRQLEKLAREGATRCVLARAEHDDAASSLDGAAEQDARAAVFALKEKLEVTTDAELKTHLSQLLRVHQDTLEQFDGLRRKFERLEARTAAEAGWLETAAFSIELAPKSELGVRELAARLHSLSPQGRAGVGRGATS
ncbi:MAG: hypothetical protein Q8K32_24110 [Archangium sp.]|nr:hypothetical protein [Archangium sp.]